MYGSKRLQRVSVGSGAILIQPGPCFLTAVRAFIDNASPANTQGYVQLFDSNSAVSSNANLIVGVTSPNWVVACVSSNVSDGDGLPTMGISFENGVVIAATTRVGNADSANLNVEVCIV